MFVELGHISLASAFAVSLLQMIVLILGVRLGVRSSIYAGVSLTYIVFVLLLVSFSTLVYSYVVSDFSVLNVVKNSHSEKPILYKIVGVWGNHEGSMFLWVLSLAFFSLLVALFSKQFPEHLRALILSCQSLITSAFLLFLLFLSNPFVRLDPPALQGNDLNPLLQDIALAVHPPLLYLGYVGFSVCFSFSVAALITGYVDKRWACWVRPWILLSWLFLTLGIIVGSYWAYYELGWGGYWVWDPVENISLMPWLSGTALLHSAIVFEKRGILKSWTLFLAILTFSLSLMGTFFVRSGILMSVHTFAVDPRRGSTLLAIAFFLIGGALLLFALRAPIFKARRLFRPISREGFIVLNNFCLITATAILFVGTLYPYFFEVWTGQKITIGPAFFNLTVGSLMVGLLFLVPFGSAIDWKRGDCAVFERLWFVFALAFVTCFVALYATSLRDILAALGIGLSAFVVFGSLANLWMKTGHQDTSLWIRARRFWGLPWSAFSSALAHMGLGIILFGIVYVATFEKKRILIMKVGDTATMAGRTIRFDRMYHVSGSNYSEIRFDFKIFETQNIVRTVTASKRLYSSRNLSTTEIGLQSYGFSQFYIVPMRVDGQKIFVHIGWKPYVICIWFGASVMAMGGCFALLGYWAHTGVYRRIGSLYNLSKRI